MRLYSKKTFFIFTIVLTLIFGANFAWAQGNTMQIQKLAIEILPEYDTPDILVVNDIDFKNSSDQDFAGELRWKVPKGSKTHIVSTDDQPQNHLQFAIISEENFDVLSWKLPTPIKPGETSNLHLEYYYNNLQGAPDKTFSFEFTPDYPVSAAEVYVIQPIKATNFKLTPDFGQAHQDEKFTFFVKNFLMSPENGIKIEASYTKTDPNPSISGQQTPVGQQGGKNNNTVKILLALGIGALIALIIYKEIRNRNAREENGDDYEDNYKNEVANREEDKKDQNFKEDEENEDELNDQNNFEEDDDKVESSLDAEKRKLGEAFRDGRISESAYLEMLADLEEQEE